jgi:hypothetical protein
MKTFSSFVAISLFAGSVNAADFSFTGNFTNADQVQEFNFTVASTSDVTLRTLSFEGGINSEGSTIAGGGFDPIISLFEAATGNFITDDDDGGNVLDSFITANLTAGNYIATVTQFASFPNGSLADGFEGSGQTDFGSRDPHWAMDILNVENASLGASYISAVGTIPEPETYVMLLAGLGLVGFIARRRKLIS